MSFGMLTALAARIAALRREFPSGSPPPIFAAVMISRVILVNALPLRASTFPFLCLIELHLLSGHRLAAPSSLGLWQYETKGPCSVSGARAQV